MSDLECPCCGDVGAEPDSEGFYRDGQPLICGCVGHVCVEEDGAATADDTFYDRIGGDLQRIGEIGCLACFKPDAFGEIVEAAKRERRHGGTIKRLGESWVRRPAARGKE